MNPSPDASSDPDDARLRQALRDSLREGPGDTGALQQRVLAQWQQRHATAPAHPVGGGLLALAGLTRLQRGLALAAVAGSLAVLAWCAQPDAGLDELMQLDVLSQIANGEM